MAKVKTPALTLSQGQLWEVVEQSTGWVAQAGANGLLLPAPQPPNLLQLTFFNSPGMFP